MKNNAMTKRYLYLAVGVFTMLFSGVLYAWSILKIPFRESLGYTDSELSLSFTLTMCFFCLGAFFGSLVCKRAGVRVTLSISAALVLAGFSTTGMLSGDMPHALLYITYALCAGTGIGIAYNAVVSTVNAHFPDKRGFSSGCLMMGFGVSTLLLGSLISVLFDSAAFGPSRTFITLGILIGAAILISALILKAPAPDAAFPAPKEKKTSRFSESFAVRDYTTKEMLSSFTFYRVFVLMAFVTAVGNSTISFARDMMISVGAAATLATTLVGVLSVFNGIGRVLTGAAYDAFGRRLTMLGSCLLTITAAAISLVGCSVSSLPLCIAGLCLVGISYGSCPTLTSAFTASFYGQAHFSVNYSLTNFNLIAAAFIANGANALLIGTGGYTAPFLMLLILSAAALGLCFSIRRP
ncbi:MAG: MFS transporter [Clostridia bacterium]|nr:MFS transporter [Clostridia bacterium]